MSVADFFELKSLNKFIEDALGPILERLDVMSMRLNDLDMRVNLINSCIGSVETHINNIQSQLVVLNQRIDNMGLRVNDVEQNMLYLRQQLQDQINNINNQLPSFFKKPRALPGYNPYNLGGSVTAQVWLFDISLVDDSNLRFYYVQFNNIAGNPGNSTNWLPLPRQFAHFIYTLHPEYFGPIAPSQALPTAYSSMGASYRLLISNTVDSIRLQYNAGPAPIAGDMLGFILIGNSRTSESDKDIEMSSEELIKYTKELSLKLRELDNSQPKTDREKVMKEAIEQMKRMTEYEFVAIPPTQPKMNQSTIAKK
jgi:hypothetical protein